jgi:GT2 family glycosyltransferase
MTPPSFGRRREGTAQVPGRLDAHREDPRVVVAVLTYRRPMQLRRVLPLLADQVARLTPTGSVLVVDNDPAGAAAADVAGIGRAEIRYVAEPRPGIAAARNRALDETAEADLLVFIDDDEVPTDGWLDNRVTAWNQWGCVAITGPVRPEYPADPPAWVRASGAFERRRRPTGSIVLGAATNNLLLDRKALTRLGVRFDERFGLTGGEDTMFSRALRRRGAEIRWCDEAEVVEPVAPERLNRRWVLRREYRAGTSWSAMELALAAPGPARPRVRASLAARAVGRSSRALVDLVAGAVLPDLGRRARAEIELVACAGMLLGALGVSFREYRRR